MRMDPWFSPWVSSKVPPRAVLVSAACDRSVPLQGAPPPSDRYVPTSAYGAFVLRRQRFRLRPFPTSWSTFPKTVGPPRLGRTRRYEHSALGRLPPEPIPASEFDSSEDVERHCKEMGSTRSRTKVLEFEIEPPLMGFLACIVQAHSSCARPGVSSSSRTVRRRMVQTLYGPCPYTLPCALPCVPRLTFVNLLTQGRT